MRKAMFALIILGLLSTYAAADGWRDFEGKAAPEITASEWLHVSAGTPSLKGLKGKVWLLNFVGMG